MLLGEGTYGSVREEGCHAVKTFGELRHMVQEYVAGSYLDSARHIVRVCEADLKELRISMDLYPMNLRQWMEEYQSQPKQNARLKIARDILIGLTEIHERGLVHGDIKPGNILLKSHPWSAYLGDLGFVSLEKYAKTQFTAAVYRDPVVRHHFGHDMYSLSIVLLELLGRLKVRKRCSYAALEQVIRKKISSPLWKKVLLEMCQEDHDQRPRAKDLLFTLFHFTLEIPPMVLPPIPELPLAEGIVAQMKGVGKRYRLAQIPRCISIFQYYVVSHSIPELYYLMYAEIFLFLSACLFRSSRFNVKRILKHTARSEEEVLLGLRDVLANETVLALLFQK